MNKTIRSVQTRKRANENVRHHLNSLPQSDNNTYVSYKLLTKPSDLRYFTSAALSAFVDKDIHIVHYTRKNNNPKIDILTPKTNYSDLQLAVLQPEQLITYDLVQGIYLFQIIGENVTEVGYFSLEGQMTKNYKFNPYYSITMSILTESEANIAKMNVARSMICLLLNKLNMKKDTILYIDSDASNGFWEYIGMLETVPRLIEEFITCIDQTDYDRALIYITKSIESNNSLRDNAYYPMHDAVARILDNMQVLTELDARRLTELANSILDLLNLHTSYNWENQVSVDRLAHFCTRHSRRRTYRRISI